jgi:hypothetical protein
MTKPHPYDKPLFVALLVLNIGSGITTIQGAMHIFPHQGIAFFSGLAIQVMLFLLLSRMAARHTPIRKWVAVFVFASLSVYTSFFAYYGTLTTTSRAPRLYDQAMTAHQRLVAEVYTPLENQLAKHQSDVVYYEDQKQKEIQGNGIPGTEGFGEMAQDFADRARLAEKEVAALKPLVDRLKPLFMEQPTKPTPQEIFDRDRKALSTVPEEYLPPSYKLNPTLKSSAYIDEASIITLLEPFRKIQEQNPPAIAALTIAIMIDGMIILLGTAIEPQRRSNPFEVYSHFIAAIIIGLKSGWATIVKAFRHRSLPFDTTRRDETTGLREGVNLVTLRLKGRGSAFLEEFYNAVSAETGLIAYERLSDNANTTFAIGYRVLLDALRSPRLRWIESMSNQWYVTEDHYAPLMNWLCQEMVYQCEQEEKQAASEEFYTATRNVPIRIPTGF